MKGKVVCTMKKLMLVFFIISLILLLIVPFSVYAENGRNLYKKVHSPALEGNLLGDSPDRQVIIYLPPGYDENTGTRYPVVYLLHGYTAGPSLWAGAPYFQYVGGVSILKICNKLIEQETIKPMIIAMPDGNNSYLGSFYTNSSVTGNWEDFITQDLIAYVDSTYRTIPQAASRGIAGHSMGGYGAIKLAMKHPDIYSSVYSLSGSYLAFEDVYLVTMRDHTLSAVKAEQFDGNPLRVKIVIASAAAFAPNPGAYFKGDFPLDENGQLVESVWQRWLQHDPFTMITSHRENLLQLRGLRFDCGTSDFDYITANRILSQALTDADIPHVFEEYDGDHHSGVRERVEKHMVPFFSETLAFSLVTAVTDDSNTPDEFTLSQNYPNPFNPVTTLNYQLGQAGMVNLIIYDLLGRKVATLVDEMKTPGSYAATWNARDFASGIYFYRIELGGSKVLTQKMMLLK